MVKLRMPCWTDEQQKAIDTRGANLLVSAAAGSGKTAVLVERIIKKICDSRNPVDIDKLLVVTFTNAAATEMKERIGKTLNKAIKDNPNSHHLYKQLTLLNKASINTLHSFCLEIVRENFYRVNLDPNFRIFDDIEGELLQIEAIEELLERYYSESEEDSSFIKFIDAYGGQNEDNLVQELILKLYDLACSNPWPELWLRNIAKSFSKLPWFQYLIPSIKTEIEGIKSLYSKCWKMVNLPEGPNVYGEIIREEMAMLDDLLGACQHSWDEMSKILENISFKRLPRITKKDNVDAELQEAVKNLRTEGKDCLNNLKIKYFSRSAGDYRKDLVKMQNYLDIICELVIDFKKIYDAKKAKANVIDFSDIEHFCLRILLDDASQPEKIIPSEVSCKIKEKYEEVLVDEYQDINDIQELILNLVAKENNMFMVGDVKQSIYRFRLAKPELFLEKYRKYTLESDSINQRIDLTKNFRCHGKIVEGVNFIFEKLMNTEVSELTYQDKEFLVYGANYPEIKSLLSVQGPIEVHIIEKNLEDNMDSLEREAKLVAQSINDLVEKGALVFDKDKEEYRPIRYRDIVILLRSLQETDKFTEQFANLGIPLYAEIGTGYFAATEIRVMVSLLKIIDNPRQDIPLASVLRSPIVGLSPQELAEIRINNQESSFYKALLTTLDKDNQKLKDKIAKFLSNLERWRTFARQGNLADLIWLLYRETGYFDYVGAMPGGIQRQANLRILHARAQKFESTSFRGLFMFLRFIERLKEKKGDLEPARALSENENVVRIMSIHKSKGLEFPVVFVAGLGKNFNFMDIRKDILLHKDLGLGPAYVDPEKRIKYPTIAKLVLENKLKRETLAEEIRILYVAMTRAREKLILVGSLRDVDKYYNKWTCFFDNTISDYQLLQGKCFLDWLGSILIYNSDSNPNWLVKLYQQDFGEKEKITREKNNQILEKIMDLKPINIDEQLFAEIKARLDWEYPYEYLLGKGTKVAVTEIKHLFQQRQAREELDIIAKKNFMKRPVFMQERVGLTPLEKGSAMHAVMQHLDFKQEFDEEKLEEFLKSLVVKEILSPEQQKSINKKNIIIFLNSPLGKRLKEGESLKRELPFSLALPAKELYPEIIDEEEKILVQGVIDCLWWEEGGWIILDYKNDYVPQDKTADFAKKYQGQINLYTKAIETIYKQRVKERFLYLFQHAQYLKI